MSDMIEELKAESRRFEETLPRLLETMRGRWVVFKGGEVEGDYSTESEAYAAGLQRFGIENVFVVAEVREVEPVLLTEGVIYGLDLGC